MNKRVWKYALTLTDNFQDHEMPENARIIHVGEQGGAIMLWVEAKIPMSGDPPIRQVRRIFRVHGTGHPITVGEYVGTAIMSPLVWHVYEIDPPGTVVLLNTQAAAPNTSPEL